MSKKLILGGVLVSSVFFGGCSLVAQPADVVTETPTKTFTGMVVVSGSLITISDGTKNTEITSRKVDLKQYAGKTVTVTGEFSGTTLYVDSVE
ncbi:hypothetical protein A3K29_05080 [Candidatus Collierbacteria bacterium RIFOXYB2_FULL_46_14]|uniref:DUF5666 domain-containing protein n=1 Tax=Candidatus Collierbacteria bacterium GW2011_GWA2_46_26 TaxID=1618381 RepID=A0A0G1PJW7_9BACT|nr:MAG: hypothetical protein UX47_C0006G0017 [Candidatus Collierbacteria bacterium GW2011_GWA2_46_26]OGD73470.1 MAG: hypothetical protein A3K29_05080 [Candidatus Collierbacteria bacterium RIFOXYB2_FULL_46_14]OGD76512.1 MAG: hypothetical protein A3K43_05080 [Candidatus Collierbacteria bacterium RIFOXYA2_FULL_46_20]OGD77848.1 MAG: hypothetical protein A3K39_05080 [Candidatus Collierbacteria bacterium RIFOXYC2_FULL_43_15]OGD81139.1 MAG: hypothetical protein A2320_05580 [Pseudomonadales bacterium G